MAATLDRPNRPEQAAAPELRATFERCVDLKAAATLLVDIDGGSLQASFEAVGRHITLRLPHSAPPLPIGSPVAVTFVVDGRWSAVLSRIEKCRTSRRGWIIDISMPRALQTELRRYPRIRIGRGSSLRASVSVNQEHFYPLVEDLSMGGAFLTFHDHAHPRWNRGTLVRIRLVFGLATLALIATVVRESTEGYGLAFNRFSENGIPNREVLQQILAELNREDIPQIQDQ